MVTLFTAWGYQVTALEFFAALTSFIGVGYGITGKQITWPWWVISSALYGIFFWQVDLIASALLQIVFIVTGIWGWYGWGPKGAIPSKLTPRQRIYLAGALLISWLILAPALHSIGAAAYWSDSFILLGSLIAQIIMVYQKYETWPLWFVVDLVATIEYAILNYWFTAILYAAFVVMAIMGWNSWLKKHKNAILAK
jgi:nicotinamide mononucleotide transporter